MKNSPCSISPAEPKLRFRVARLRQGLGARIEWALLNYMLDIHRKNGFEQIIPPLLGPP